LQNNIHADVGK